MVMEQVEEELMSESGCRVRLRVSFKWPKLAKQFWLACPAELLAEQGCVWPRNFTLPAWTLNITSKRNFGDVKFRRPFRHQEAGLNDGVVRGLFE